MVGLLVSHVLQRLLRRPLQIGRSIRRQFLQAIRATRLHLALQVLQVLQEAGITAGLEDVGDGGDGQRAAGEDGRHVERVGAGRIGDVQIAVECFGERAEEVHRDRIERTPRHVHLVARQRVAMIRHRQRVAELDAEGQIPLRRDRLEVLDQLQRTVILQIVVEDRVGDVDRGEPQALVQDLHHPRLAQQRGIEFDEGVQPALLHQILGDLLDLIRRAAVHCREGDAVDDPGRNLKIGGKALLLQHCPEAVDLLGGVIQLIHKAYHPRLLNALQVIADAHVEDRAEGRLLKATLP